MKGKFSLIATVMNEEDTIEDFLRSIINQKIRPDEFIIVDGNSKDFTAKIIREYSKKNKWIKLIIKKSNISKGRNIAIKNAKNDIIMVADGGSEYKNDWTEKLFNGFDGQVSFGVDVPLAKTKFEKILGKKLCHKRKQGSSRNMIFLKKIWEEVGGYPENLKIGEDTLFDERIKKRGYKITHVKDAICYWVMRKNFKELRKQFFRYGYWDGIAYKKYKMLPKKHILTIVILTISIPILPILFFISKFSLSLRIDVCRRWSYIKGFYQGWKGNNNEN